MTGSRVVTANPSLRIAALKEKAVPTATSSLPASVQGSVPAGGQLPIQSALAPIDSRVICLAGRTVDNCRTTNNPRSARLEIETRLRGGRLNVC
jgi:hypothetical protein